MNGQPIEIRTCLHCGELFEPKKPKHKFCTRKCFITEYRKRQKKANYPLKYKCPQCGHTVVLDFDPIKDDLKWRYYKCKHCDYSNN